MDSLYVIIKPIITSFAHTPEFIGFVIALVTAILAYLKFPLWARNAIINIISALIHAPANVEMETRAAKEHGKIFTSQEKLDMAVVKVNEALKPKEKKLLNIITIGKGAGWAIQNVVLPAFQIFWKKK